MTTHSDEVTSSLTEESDLTVPRGIPSPALIAIAAGLRTARAQRGISTRKLGRMTSTTASALSDFEHGKRRPESTKVAYILGMLQAPAATYDQLVDLADRVDDLDLLDPTGRDETLLRTELEQLSTHVFEWSPALFPTTLRSAAYTRALQETGLLATDITPRGFVAAPTQEDTATGWEPLHTILIGEAATRPDVCPPDVLHDQIEEMTAVTNLLHIPVRLVPASACPPGLVEPFTLYENYAGPFAVSVQHHPGTVYSTNPATVARYNKILTTLRHGATERLQP
jgi:transcriptional regulator with XRE-family HTH domain